ncbi:sarcosine oxidase subunit delta [Rhodoligotrophos defluvii]|uniref:sarcosine oxidase subunit delta n=1 Tax=Rhodoligotrophos defluvii TaxID=2561934 RepID=UPI0010C9D143|nr:sarcosine oxidase subunit delta [Rhodoligotrophos defluvii]
MLINCPYCGLRSLEEFTYGGDASLERPDLADEDMERWYTYVYLRDNPRGPHKEFWHHLYGCRQWLVATRDTLTHQVTSVVPARDVVKPADLPEVQSPAEARPKRVAGMKP